jgi:hypothetical protein
LEDVRQFLRVGIIPFLPEFLDSRFQNRLQSGLSRRGVGLVYAPMMPQSISYVGIVSPQPLLGYLPIVDAHARNLRRGIEFIREFRVISTQRVIDEARLIPRRDLGVLRHILKLFYVLSPGLICAYGVRAAAANRAASNLTMGKNRHYHGPTGSQDEDPSPVLYHTEEFRRAQGICQPMKRKLTHFLTRRPARRGA